MSELQLGLLAIGALVVAGVLAYNRWQERGARREAGRGLAFGPGHLDVLAEPAAERHETGPGPGQSAAVREVAAAAPVPDPRIDYVVELEFPQVVSESVFAAQWKAHERRYAGRVLFGLPGARKLRAGLQLVTREGPVSEAELIEFRTAIESLAAATGATVAAPEMRQAVETARDLDRFCAESDVQVVIHVKAAPGQEFPLERARAAAQAAGMTPEGDARLLHRDAEGTPLYALDLHEGAALTFDVPRTPDTRRSFRQMASFASRLAAVVGGAMVDDAGNALDERAVAAIAAQLETIRGAFEARGIAPGSPEAIRLFS